MTLSFDRYYAEERARQQLFQYARGGFIKPTDTYFLGRHGGKSYSLHGLSFTGGIDTPGYANSEWVSPPKPTTENVTTLNVAQNPNNSKPPVVMLNGVPVHSVTNIKVSEIGMKGLTEVTMSFYTAIGEQPKRDPRMAMG